MSRDTAPAPYRTAQNGDARQTRNEAPAHHDASLHAPYGVLIQNTRIPMSMSTEPQESSGSLADGAPKQAADGDALVVQKQQIHQRRDVMLGMFRYHTAGLLTCRQRACPMMHHIVFDSIKRDCVGKPHRVTYIVSTIPRQAAQYSTLFSTLPPDVNIVSPHLRSDQPRRTHAHSHSCTAAHEAPAGLDSCPARHCSPTGIVNRSPGKCDFFSLQQLVPRRLHGDAKKILQAGKPPSALQNTTSMGTRRC